jgi:hypothetical protein
MNIIESLDTEPEKWAQLEFTLEHVDGKRLWTGNIPIIHTNTYPATPMSFVTKVRLYLAIRRWANRLSMEISND